MKAVITGITGQDGAYLTQLLLEKGYQVFGTYRRTSSVNFWRLKELGVLSHPNLTLMEYDLTDLSATIRLLQKTSPQEVYNLAAQSVVRSSFNQPLKTLDASGAGVVNILDAIRNVDPMIRLYQASTSEMFGKTTTMPQTENTPFYPRNPYGIAKLYAHWMIIHYREYYGLFAVSGILYNHESPLRGEEFVTRKITKSVARIALGLQSIMELGNLDAKRDWGYAKEYVEGMWLMLQQKKPDSYLLATGCAETVRSFVEQAFESVNITIEWQGEGIDEIAINKANKEMVVKVNPDFYRPAEVELLVGDPSKAKRELGWQANTTLGELCTVMVAEDMRRERSSMI